MSIKSGFFGKKKAHKSSVVFTFIADDFVNDDKDLMEMKQIAVDLILLYLREVFQTSI